MNAFCLTETHFGISQMLVIAFLDFLEWLFSIDPLKPGSLCQHGSVSGRYLTLGTWSCVDSIAKASVSLLFCFASQV